MNRDFFTGLERWRDMAGEAAGRGWVVYGGDRRESRAEVEVVPWRSIGALTGGPDEPPGRP